MLEEFSKARITNVPFAFRGSVAPQEDWLGAWVNWLFLCPADGSSECLSSAEQMESEDMLSALGWSREDRPRPSSKPTSGAFPTLSPMVVMKNVLVKQVRRTARASLLCTLEFLSFLCTEFLSAKEGCEKHATRNHTSKCCAPGKTVWPFSYWPGLKKGIQESGHVFSFSRQ